MRNYLALPPRSTAEEVMRDALVLQIPGALEMVTMVLSLRVNRRSRRTVLHATEAFTKTSPPRWFGILLQQVWNTYRLFIGHASSKTYIYLR